MRERVVRVEVVDVAGRDEREPGLVGERDEVRVDAQLLLDAAVLHLDVLGVAAEDLYEAVEVLTRVLAASLGERLGHAAREAARERDDALRVALEQLPVDARLVVVPLEVAERAELDQVRVALVRLGEEGQVRVPLRLRLAVVGDVDLAPDERLDAQLPRLPVELDDARERAVVRERDGRHLEPRGLLHESGDPARAVQDRVLRVDVQVDEGDGGARSGGSHGRAIVLPSSDGNLGPPRRRPRPSYLVRGDPLMATRTVPDRHAMATVETEHDVLRDRALVLAEELGLDRSAWFLHVLEDGRDRGDPTDVGVLVRAYWELQRISGRADIEQQWRSLADSLGHGDAA